MPLDDAIAYMRRVVENYNDETDEAILWFLVELREARELMNNHSASDLDDFYTRMNHILGE